jgi:hypothetical protein
MAVANQSLETFLVHVMAVDVPVANSSDFAAGDPGL